MSSGEKPLVQLIGIGKRYGTGPTAFDLCLAPYIVQSPDRRGL